MEKYSIPVFETEEGPILDTYTLMERDSSRTSFLPEEIAIIKKMNEDAQKCFEALEDKGGYRSFISTPYYRRIRDNIRCGSFLDVWHDYIQLFGISNDEAIKRYCVRQPEIDEQGNKEQEGPEL